MTAELRALPRTEAGRRWAANPDWWLLDGEHEQAVACILAVEAEAAPLDTAMARVMAAMPEGWHLAALVSDGRDNPGWVAEARFGMFGDRRSDVGPTPAAALNALTEKMAAIAAEYDRLGGG